MSKKTYLKVLEETQLIAILRGIKPSEVLTIAHELVTCGFRIIEVPMNTPKALKSIKKLSHHYRNHKEIIIGAGTVCHTKELSKLSKVGCQLIISPHTDKKIIRKTKALGMVSCAGFTTASEAYTAINAGADLLKLFPFSRLGAAYYHDLTAILPKHIPIIAVGGIEAHNIRNFLDAGIHYFGIGSALYHRGVTSTQLQRSASGFIKEIKKCQLS